MAINDYILCKICGVKLLYDGAEEGSMTNREWYKERFGKDIEMTCPSCDKLDADIEHTTEPVAWIRTAQDGRKHTVTGTSKPMPIDGYDCEPLYTRPAPKREPLSDYDVCEEYITTIKEEPWTRIKAYFAGVRFAEEHHQITGGKDE